MMADEAFSVMQDVVPPKLWWRIQGTSSLRLA
jgi:hypothetical protein